VVIDGEGRLRWLLVPAPIAPASATEPPLPLTGGQKAAAAVLLLQHCTHAFTEEVLTCHLNVTALTYSHPIPHPTSDGEARA
jgi:hypothetical protein